MVLATKNEEINRTVASKKRLLSTMIPGVILLLMPISFLFFDPILYFAEYQVRLENGSMLHGLLSKEFVGPKVYAYLFNVTNAEAFASGRDDKLKVQEAGPFVYQEYRTNEDLEINREPGIMRYTPKLRVEFIREESVADPKDVQLVVPNVPLLSAATLMSKNSYFVREMFNIYAKSLGSKGFINVSAYDHFWGYPDPFIQLANNVVPGLIYFKSIGLLERLYDPVADYRLELGTTNADKFSVKKATRFKANRNYQDLIDDMKYFNDSYEGAVYPPDMSPDMSIYIYRHSICKTFRLQYQGTRKMFYGGDGFVYNIHNSTFDDRELCDTKGWCPTGLKNMSPCYFDFPFALSKGHYLDGDPLLRSKVEGLEPDRKEHDIETVIDPKIGITISGAITLQLSLFLTDVGYNTETRRFKDTVVPLSYIKIRSPPMLEETRQALRTMYCTGPYILLACKIGLILIGLALLANSAKLIYWNWVASNENIILDKTLVTNLAQSHLPLLYKK